MAAAGTSVTFLKNFVYSVTLSGTTYTLNVNNVTNVRPVGYVDAALAADLVESGLAAINS